MSGSLNQAQLIGHLGKDPEIRRTAAGDPVATFRLATSETWRDKGSGEKRETTEWHTVVIFNETLCTVADQYLRKGAKVFVQGQIKTRKWQGQDGQDRYSTEIVLGRFGGILTMLDRAERPAREPDGYGTTTSRPSTPPTSSGGSVLGRGTGSDIDDEIPF